MQRKEKPMIEVENLSKSFGRHQVLHSISFKMYEGERVALIGPSGSGKSTLINILTRSIGYDGGKIRIDGRDIEEYQGNKDYAKKVGVIRQQFDLVRELEVVHNVLAGNLHTWGFFKSLRSLLQPVNRNQALQALADVGIEDKGFNVTSSLSGGEQQRVAIARLIVQNPDILIADEPIASLDPTRANSVMELLSRLVHDNHKTLFASIHSVEHVLNYFDRVIGIREGNVLIDEKIEDITPEILEQLYEIQEVGDEEVSNALS